MVQEDNISNCTKYYMVSNRQDDNGRKGSMIFWPCVFTDNYLYIKKEKGKIILIILVYIDDMVVATPESMHIVSFKMLWDALDTNNFYFILFYFILILFSFSFSLRWWKGTWHHSHMTGHMMWYHRPRTWRMLWTKTFRVR